MKIGNNIIPIIMIGAFSVFVAVYAYGCRKTRAIEDCVYAWTKGEIFCAECKGRERIKYVHVNDEFKDTSGKRLRLVYITTERHYGEERAFEALATVGSSRIEHLAVGKWPGRMWDSNGED